MTTMFFGRKLLIGVLAFGTVAGYASGFASFGHCATRHHEARRAAFEARVADVCTRSAERVYQGRSHEVLHLVPAVARPAAGAGARPGSE
jgi:hypothetical protein